MAPRSPVRLRDEESPDRQRDLQNDAESRMPRVVVIVYSAPVRVHDTSSRGAQ